MTAAQLCGAVHPYRCPPAVPASQTAAAPSQTAAPASQTAVRAERRASLAAARSSVPPTARNRVGWSSQPAVGARWPTNEGGVTLRSHPNLVAGSGAGRASWGAASAPGPSSLRPTCTTLGFTPFFGLHQQWGQPSAASTDRLDCMLTPDEQTGHKGTQTKVTGCPDLL